MKIVLFVAHLRAGGAEQVATLLSSGMIASGHEVFIAAASLEGELAKRVHRDCTPIDLESRKPIRARKRLADVVNQIEPDAVICFGIYTGIAASLSRPSWKCSPVLVIRNENNLLLDWKQSSPLNRMIGPILSRWAARRARVVAVSHSLAPATASYLRIRPDHITTILNPVIDDTDNSFPAMTPAAHVQLGQDYIPTLVAMGRLEHQKGFDVLIDAFSLVVRDAACRLVIFGEGTLRPVLQARIDALDLGGSILLAGHTQNPLEQMRSAHAFVLSSRFEGFGLVLVEALLAGTQVISTDCDYGPSEILEHGRYGRLVPVEDAKSLSKAMLDSLARPNCHERPDADWFRKFTATEAARQHIELIESSV